MITDPVGILQDRLSKFRTGTGGQASACCPFHSERNPSFRVNINSDSERFLSYFCHGCHAKGSGRTLLQHLLGETTEIIDSLLPRYTIPIPSLGETKEVKDTYIPEHVLGGFTGWILDDLEASGFEREILKTFEVGYDKAGDRYVYPIRDHVGRLVALYMRNKYRRPKYRPYMASDLPEGLLPSTYIFNKGKHIWNMNKELNASTHETPVVVVEGFKACMWVKQCLGDSVRCIALMGTHISDAQLQKLQWLGGPFLVFLDNTVSACKASEVIAHKLLEDGFLARTISYPESSFGGAQPDNLTTKELVEILSCPS